MTSKKYFLWVLGLAIGLPLAWVTYNLCINDFGLWYSKDNCYINKYERASKYLLTKRYIPENFNGLLIGPSYSDNIYTQPIKDFKVYNLSIGGGNATELKLLVESAMNTGKFKILIVCMSPFITKDHGIKSNQLTQTTYIDTLCGELSFKIFCSKIAIQLNSESHAEFNNSQWGTTNFQLKAWKKTKFASENLPYLDLPSEYGSHTDFVDTRAVDQLKELFELARAKNINIIAYYYPIYKGLFNKQYGSQGWKDYKNQVHHVFTEKDLVFDMNASEYREFTRNIDNYSDGHLSESGAHVFSKLLASKVQQWRKQHLHFQDLANSTIDKSH
ncbi:hypothetical protein JYU15_00905 [bacterium AH-315-I18]|nr:hypothetical protein [Phycisphaeraceae bacterium]MBN4060971.1 hypothetical protein [bacterium AH-315-I18]